MYKTLALFIFFPFFLFSQGNASLKVAVLGNSITINTPEPSIGWTNSCGMAASSIEKDYVSLLTNDIKRYQPEAEVIRGNIAAFERDFLNYKPTNLLVYRDFKPDILIIRIGENLPNYFDSNTFYLKLKELIDYIGNQRQMKVYVSNCFWSDIHKDYSLLGVCQTYKYDFINLGGLYDDKTNVALGQFANVFVSDHPSDAGMKAIRDKVWQAILPEIRRRFQTRYYEIGNRFYITNDTITIGFDKTLGGAIVQLSKNSDTRNLINTFNNGRLMGLSTSIQTPQTWKPSGTNIKHISDLLPTQKDIPKNWNGVIQGNLANGLDGAEFMGGSPISTKFDANTGELNIKSNLWQLAYLNEKSAKVFSKVDAQATNEYSIILKGNSVKIKVKQTRNIDGLAANATTQFLNYAWLDKDFDKWQYYKGSNPWKNETIQSQNLKDLKTETLTDSLSENWHAVVDKNDFGLGMYWKDNGKVKVGQKTDITQAKDFSASFMGFSRESSQSTKGTSENEIFFVVGTTREIREFACQQYGKCICENKDPEGFLDEANCQKILGWALDKGSLKEAVDVILTIDDKKIATVSASLERADLVKVFNNQDARYHGFLYTMPDDGWWKDGKSHVVKARICGQNDKFIAQSGKVINCPTKQTETPVPDPTIKTELVGNIDLADCYQVSGWALDKFDLGKTLSVDIFINNVKVANIPAAVSRKDLVSAFGGAALAEKHGFVYTLPTLSKGLHQINVKFVNSEQKLPNSPIQIGCGVSAVPDASIDYPFITSGPVSTEDLEVFPNPTPNFITVRMFYPGPERFTLQVSNSSGQVIWEKENYGQNGSVSYNIDLSEYGRGSFFVQLKKQRKILTQKVIKE